VALDVLGRQASADGLDLYFELLQASSDELEQRTLRAVASEALLAMLRKDGATAAALVYSPWGRRSGAHLNPSVTLAFSAPGDDGTPSPASLPTAGPCPCGRSTSYVVKYSTTDTITDQSSFDGAANFVNAIVPQDALQPESITVTGLSPNTQYWFAVEAVDEKGNHSGCCDPPLSGKSKVVSATTLQASDVIPPGPITDLQEIAVTDQTVTLQWTARGDDGNVGTATAYNVRYAHTPITSINEFNKATQAVTNPPAPLASGLTETRTVTLAPYQFMTSDTVYYFAIVAIDDGNNTSPLGTLTNSNVDAACAIDCRVRTLLRPQYNLVSAPRQGPLSPTDLFGPLDLLTDPCGSGDLPCLYKWVSTGLTNIDGDYQLMNPDPCDPFCVMEGDGYFFYTADVSLLTTALGGPVPTHPDSDGHYTGSNPSGLHAHILLDRDGAGPELSAGWHLIGNLFDKDVLLKDVNVRLVDDGGSCTGAVKTFDEAVTAGWVGNSIYVSTTNDGAGSTPVPYDDGNPLTQDATLQPWQSYWIQVLQNDCTYELVMPKPN